MWLALTKAHLARPTAGPDGELRERIERLERDLMVQRNRADVNSLFKDEHDRWVGGWAGMSGLRCMEGWRLMGGRVGE